MIRYFDYRPQLRQHREEIDDAVARVLESGRLILGDEVDAFERECARYLGVDGAVGVGSGTDAVALALRALEIGRGDEVLTVANAGVPPVAAIRAAGATPVFVDVDPATLLMDPEKLEAARTAKTRAVLAVHLYGQPVDLDPVTAFAARHRLAVVEDCAQSFGARYGDAHTGTLGAIGCHSFYPTKNLGAFGDAGLCVTRDSELERRIRALRMYGFDAERHARVEGMNSRLDELQAALLRVKLRHLDRALHDRRALARRYERGFADAGFPLLRKTARGEHTYHLFVVRVPDRERLVGRLRDREIGFGFHYPEPVHLMQAYRFLGWKPGSLPVTELACSEVLSLPLYPGMPDHDVDQVVDAVASACRVG